MNARAVVLTVVGGGLALVVLGLAVRADAIDLAVYRGGAEVVRSGGHLYRGPVWNGLLFTYPPFSALLFTPLAVMSGTAAKVLAVVGNGALLVFVVRRSWLSLGVRAIAPVVGVVAALLLTETVHASVYVGQINLLLVALVLGDLTGRDGVWWRGVGVGLAAGLKLTPLIFIGYLLVVRRFREAAVAATTAAGTVILGFIVLPLDSADYWFGGMFADTGRIYADLTSPHNQSIRGLLLRGGFPPWVWAVAAVVVCAATLVVATQLTRRGDRLLAITVVGLGAAAISPWSWGHHWVWVAPLVVVVADRLWHRRFWWCVPAVLVLGTLPLVLALADPPDGSGPAVVTGLLQFVVGNLYLLVFLAVLAVSARDQPPVGTTIGVTS